MANDGSEASPAGRVLAAAMVAYGHGDLDEVAALIHPDAEIQMLLLGGGSARGPEELRDALARGESLVHEPTVLQVESIADDAAIMVGRIRYTDTRGGLTDREATWLTVLRDERLWRVRVFASAEEARTAYAEMRAGDVPDHP